MATGPPGVSSPALTLLTPIRDIVNHSLKNCSFPHQYKKAIVIPLLKKSGLYWDQLKNLPFISKVIEKVVLVRINKHLDRNDLNQTFQSAYRKFHSTETALLKVHSDSASALEKRNMSVLILLYLCAAFDTIDHSILLKRLADRFSIRGTALDWFISYLTGRTQLVKAAENYSSHSSLWGATRQHFRPYAFLYVYRTGCRHCFAQLLMCPSIRRLYTSLGNTS